jgi:hypothetical protein
MQTGSYLAEVHPCPECFAPVANVARRCQHCGADQPNVDQDGYKRMAEAFLQPAEAAEDDRSASSLEDRFSLKRLALRLRPQPKTM